MSGSGYDVLAAMQLSLGKPSTNNVRKAIAISSKDKAALRHISKEEQDKAFTEALKILAVKKPANTLKITGGPLVAHYKIIGEKIASNHPKALAEVIQELGPVLQSQRLTRAGLSDLGRANFEAATWALANLLHHSRFEKAAAASLQEKFNEHSRDDRDINDIKPKKSAQPVETRVLGQFNVAVYARKSDRFWLGTDKTSSISNEAFAVLEYLTARADKEVPQSELEALFRDRSRPHIVASSALANLRRGIRNALEISDSQPQGVVVSRDEGRTVMYKSAPKAP